MTGVNPGMQPRFIGPASLMAAAIREFKRPLGRSAAQYLVASMLPPVLA